MHNRYQILILTNVWHDVGPSFLWVCAIQKIPFSVLAGNTHKGLAYVIFHANGRGRGKARSQGNEQKNRAVSRREQSTEVRGSRQSEKGDC